ncbi:unnamed protein product [Diplocarpon coronariae]
MPSRSTPNLGTYGEKPGLFQSRTTRPSTPSQSKPTLAILSPPPTSAHVSPPYGHFSSPSKKSRPLLRTRHSLPSNPHATAEKQARAHSYPPRKLSLPLVAKGSFVVSARPMLSRLRSGLGRLFAKKGEEESEESEKCETDAASLHLELPEWVSRDKSEIEYLRRMEREALSGRENGIVV